MKLKGLYLLSLCALSLVLMAANCMHGGSKTPDPVQAAEPSPEGDSGDPELPDSIAEDEFTSPPEGQEPSPDSGDPGDAGQNKHAESPEAAGEDSAEDDLFGSPGEDGGPPMEGMEDTPGSDSNDESTFEPESSGTDVEAEP